MKRPERKNILLTGRPGCGKTTLIMSLARRLSDRRVRGFYTEEIRSGGRRTGFAVRTFSGKEGTLSSVFFSHGPRVGRYRVDVESFEAIIGPELEADPKRTDVFVIDEIGKMECFSRRFVEAMQAILDGPVPVVATVAQRGSGFIAKVRARPDVTLLEVTRRDRDALPDRIARMIAPPAMDTWMRRAVNRTCAPIFRSFSRMV